MDNIRYAAYRTAMKMRFIQKRLRCKLECHCFKITSFHCLPFLPRIYEQCKIYTQLMSLLSVDLVELTTVEGVFERHGFSANRDPFVDAPSLYNVLLDIFVLTRYTDATRRIDKEQAAELLLNWMLNLYDVYVLNDLGIGILRSLFIFFQWQYSLSNKFESIMIKILFL